MNQKFLIGFMGAAIIFLAGTTIYFSRYDISLVPNSIQAVNDKTKEITQEDLNKIQKSPLANIMETNLFNFDKAIDAYPGKVNLKIEVLGPEKMKVNVAASGIPDDVIMSQEYELVIEQQEDWGWETTSKKLISEKCYSGRACENINYEDIK